MKPKLTEIDLSKTTKNGGAGLEVGSTYLCLIGGNFFCGTFGKQWYGLNFNGWYSGLQYDPPNTNMSMFQRMWRVDNADTIAKESEMEYAVGCREWAIKNHMTSNGKTIDESTPIEAFLYRPKVSAMPSDDDDDDDDEYYEYDEEDNY
jgi:hypothetical protein